MCSVRTIGTISRRPPAASPKPPFKLNSKQVEKVREQKREHWDGFVAAHRAATLEYNNSLTTGKTLIIGHRPCDIAEKHTAALIKSGSPHRITARALREWFKQGKAPGVAPKKPGRKPDPKVPPEPTAV